MATLNRFKKLPLETATTSNRFKGLTDEVAVAPTPVVQSAPVVQSQPEAPARDRFGLPVSYLSQGKATPPAPLPQESIWSKAAKVILPKKAEDFFGLNETPEQKQMKQDITTAYENKWATEDMKRLQERIDPVTGKLPTQTAAGVLKETPGEKYLPFVGAVPSIKDAMSLYGAAKRLEKGENTPVDDYVLAKFKAESERDSTFGAKVTNILTEIPSFALELAATGGIFTGVKAATQKAITEGLETGVEKTARRKMLESLVTRSAGSAAGATAQTVPARFMEITAETIQNMTPEYQYRPGEDKLFNAYISKEGDNVWKSAAKALSNQWVEVLSEKSGGIFNEMAAPVKNKILKLGVFKSLLKNNPNLTSNQFMKLVNSAGWNGIFAEMGEERIGEVMRGILTQVGLSEEGFKFPSKEQLLLELVSFSIPGVMIGAVNKGLQTGSFQQPQAGAVPPTTGTTPPPPPTPPASDVTTTVDEERRDYMAELNALQNHPDPKVAQMANTLYYDVSKTHPRDQQSVAKSMVESFNLPEKQAPEVFKQEKLFNKGETVTPDGVPVPKNAGPGYKKFTNGIDKMVKSGTLLPEDATILKTLFENTSDNYLAQINLGESSRMSALGRFSIQQSRMTGEVRPESNKLLMQSRLAQKGLTAADQEPAKVFTHEFGHASWYMVLTQEERNMVERVYTQLGREGRRELFRGGLSAQDEGTNAAYYAKNVREFFAESFAGYVMENKVPAKEMQPLLQRLATKFYEGLKRLVNRKQHPAILRLRPIFERALSGDKTTPLSELMAQEPPSFKQELQQMFETFPKPGVATKEVPAESIFPSGAIKEKAIEPTPDTGSPMDAFTLPPEIEAPTIEKVIESETRTPINERVRWIDYLRTPWRVFERMGIRPSYQSLLKGYEAYVKELPGNIDKITAWSKEVPKESNERIFRFLDGEAIELNAQEAKVAGEIKVWMKEWADRLGMEPDSRISEYITHIFPFGKGGEIPEEIAFIINKKIPGSVFNPFLLQRKGAEGYLKDTWKALDAYVKRATRKVNMDPALAELKEASAKLTEPSQLNYLNRYIGAVNLRPTELDTSLDNHIKENFGYLFGARPTAAITRFIRQTIARAKIGGSIVSFAKNLTQGVNTFSELGTGYTTRGYIDLVRFGGKELQENGVLVAPFVEDRTYSAVKKMAEKFDNALFLNMNASELVNRGAAYYGAKAKFLAGKITPKEFKAALGKDMPENYTPTLEDAVDYGKFVSAKTQFLFGPLDTPVALNSDIAKMVAQFQTFGLKQQEFIWNMVGAKEYAKLMRYLISSMLLFAWIGSAFGMKWDDSFKTLRWGAPPIITFFKDVLGAIFGVKDQYGNVPSGATRARTVGTSLFTNLVPGGAQMKRSYEGFQAVNQGASKTASGNFQYKIDKTPMNYVRGTLFGKANLPEAQTYYDKKGKPKAPTANRFKGL